MEEFTFKYFNCTKIYQILNNSKKVAIWTHHVSGKEVTREVIYID